MKAVYGGMGTGKCACEGKNLDRFIQPIILHILSREACSGYVVIQRMRAYATYAGESPDPTGVYRYLRMMQRKGLIARQQTVDEEGKNEGPLAITPEGMACLVSWRQTLAEYAKTIEKLVGECT